MPGKLNGPALASLTAGSILIWSGIKGWSVLATIGDVISGKQPKQPSIYPLTSGENAGSTGGTGGNTGSIIADTALQYQGHLYKYGGAPGASGQNPWDCSSFCNFVIGRKLGMAIPGYGPGKYPGTVHGPPTGSWAIWPGLHHKSRNNIVAGDIIIWPTHMGIAISPTEMVSATGPDGTPSTKRDPIHGGGPVGESIIVVGSL
jgi:hypothetical protein